VVVGSGGALLKHEPKEMSGIEPVHGGIRSKKAIAGMFATAGGLKTKNPQLAAEMLQGAMAGIVRRLLESDAPEKEAEGFRRELITLACAYLDACSARVSVRAAGAIDDAAPIGGT
jgi:Tetracyclin repressor-like, C-terminal domain